MFGQILSSFIVHLGENKMIRPMLRSVVIAGFLGAALASGAALAADQPYKADLAHTQILFSVNHMGTSTMHGSFKKFTVDIKFDPKKPAKTSLTTVIDIDSVDTGFGPRDTHLKSPDFFDVAKYPNMTFKSTKVDVTGADTAKLTGNLTMLGVTKPLTLDVKMTGTGPSMAPGAMVYGFEATGTIKRSDWGMTKYVPAAGSKMGVGDDINVVIESEINNAPPMGPPPAAVKKN
jgi:polyisoprenoid-binding protein YceI